MKKLFFKISNDIVKYCFAFFCALYAICNILFTYWINNLSYYEKSINIGINIFNIVLLICFLFILYLLIKKNFFNINEKYLLLGFLLLCLITGLIWIFINDPILKERDDAYNCFNAALSIYKGSLSSLKQGAYICNYPNNLGLVTYDLLHIYLFGEYNCLYSIRIVNLSFVLLGYYSLYKIGTLVFKNNRIFNCVLIMLMFGSMQFVFYTFFIYGNCLSYALSLSSVWLLLEYFDKRKLLNLIISAICIALSISIKMNSLIILIAEIIYLILDFINNKKLLVVLFLVLSLSGIFVGTKGVQHYWENKAGVNYDELKLPTICWLAYGMNYDPRNPGHYTNQFEVFHVENGYKVEYTSLEAKTFINMCLEHFKKNPVAGITYYIKKFIVSWANPQYEAFDQYRELHNNDFVLNVISGNINVGLNYFWDTVANLASIGVLSFVVLNFKKINLKQMLPAVIVIGGFFFHFIWEVKAIYLYQYYMYLLVYAAYGIALLLNRTND